MDRYSKIVFTLIALALWANLFGGVAPLMGAANPQGSAQPAAVYLVAGPAAVAPVVLAVPANRPPGG